jgi:hypothetical protein
MRNLPIISLFHWKNPSKSTKMLVEEEKREIVLTQCNNIINLSIPVYNLL